MANCKQLASNKTPICLFTMAICNSSLFMIVTLYFSFIIPLATPLNFNLPNITPDDHIKTYADASISSEGLELTPAQQQKAGRATFVQPLHLWDKASGKLADFTTNFSFVIDSNGSTAYGDGLAFFLVPNPSSSLLVTKGGALGLPIDSGTINPSSDFVAVEFDTYYDNGWDPLPATSSPGTHVGININSLGSNASETWWSNITDGRESKAWIRYDSTSQILRVAFTNFKNNTQEEVVQDTLNYTIDLRKYLPEWVDVGFSAATGGSVETSIVKSWEFSSNLKNAKAPVLDPVPVTPSPSSVPVIPSPSPGTISGENIPGQKKNNKALVLGLSVGLCVLVSGILSWLGIGLWKKRSTRGKEETEVIFDLAMDDEFEKGSGPKKFSYAELAHATNNFSEEEKLGEGGFGGVYRGFCRESNSYVAIKRVSRGSKQGLKEYASEVKIISRLRHRNLVQLIGWCHEKEELLLVYELMPNGSLDTHLFKGKSLLTWAMRYRIAQGLASALLYLHEEWEQCVVHRDIKSSNIMLDSNFNAKLGDFGLARLVDHEKGLQTTVLAGTMGYMAPECVITVKASKVSDVYSFGIVALEIACGRKPIDLKAQETQIIMVEWVRDLYRMGKLLEAADPKLCGDFDEQEMERLMIVGLSCAHPDYNLRLSIREAIQVLNFESPLPILQSKLPVPTYSASPSRTERRPTSSASSGAGFPHPKYTIRILRFSSSIRSI
uniref:non-specific serine/threonine protein kinase n=1 Tax=Davidia involucrata TaxID=16924 RepID=A0A5B7B263_DAVIN